MLNKYVAYKHIAYKKYYSKRIYLMDMWNFKGEYCCIRLQVENIQKHCQIVLENH